VPRIQCTYPCRSPDALCAACNPVLRCLTRTASKQKDREKAKRDREREECDRKAREAFLRLCEEVASDMTPESK
jgi:hypothetical protein